MRTPPRRAISPARRGGPSLRVVWGLIAPLGVAALVWGSGGAPAASGVPPGPGGMSWSNGVVVCNFTIDHPAVTVSGAVRNDSGLYAGFESLEELAPNGTVRAWANLTGPQWAIVYSSSREQVALNYTAAVPAMAGGVGASSIGSVHVSASISTAYSDGATPASSSRVALNLTASSWPWVSASDSLVLVVPLWPGNTATERMIVDPESPTSVDNNAVATDAPQEYFTGGTAVTVTSAAGVNTTLAVAPRLALTPGYGTLTVPLASNGAAFASVTWSSELGLVVNAKPLGLPLYDYIAVTAGAAVVSLGAAGVLRRVRRRPSDLDEVTEEA